MLDFAHNTTSYQASIYMCVADSVYDSGICMIERKKKYNWQKLL